MAKGLAEAVLGEIRPRGVSPKVARTLPQGAGPKRPARGGGLSLYARLWGAGQGGASVVLKKIHNGGTHSPKELGQQLDYLFSKATWCGGNAVDFDGRRQSLTPDERKEIVSSWTDHWQRNPKNGHTSHLLLSFPPEVSGRKARIIAEDWAADMFENPDARGDQWAYVAALHTDRAHPHVHVVVQNRGIDNDKWFYMAKGHAFDILSMKERLAEIASDHGVALETTSRVERGILTYCAGRAEIEDARRAGRAVREVARSGLALETALAEVKVVSAAYRQLAFVAVKTDARDIALRMVGAAKALDEGRPVLPRREAIVVDDGQSGAGAVAAAPRSWAEFENHLEGWITRIGGKMRTLSPEGQAKLRPELNDITARALEVLGDKRGAELAREAPKSALYRSALSAAKPVLDGVGTELSASRAKWLKGNLAKEATAFGLDDASITGRIAAGASSAFEEREWIKADIASVAAAKGLDLNRKTDRTAAAGTVDHFYERARNIIHEACGLEAETHVARLRTTLGNMVKMAERLGFVHFETDADAIGLVDHLKARYGGSIIRDLAVGKTNLLARDFASADERGKIAVAVTLAALDHEAFGLTPNEAKAANDRLTSSRGDGNGPSLDDDRER